VNSEVSLLSLVACALYAVVCVVCIRAGFEARSKRQHGWHLRTWFFAAVLFVVLIVSRLLGLGRRNIAVALVWGACGVMIATIAMRTISLHALDRLLNGPLKLNWVGDMGSSLVVLAAAIFYIGVVSGRIGRKR